MERKTTIKLNFYININKISIFDSIISKLAISKKELKLFMKSKRISLDNSLIEGKEYLIYFFATSALVLFLIKLFYNLYLNNPSFHMFIQSKGIFL